YLAKGKLSLLCLSRQYGQEIALTTVGDYRGRRSRATPSSAKVTFSSPRSRRLLKPGARSSPTSQPISVWLRLRFTSYGLATTPILDTSNIASRAVRSLTRVHTLCKAWVTSDVLVLDSSKNSRSSTWILRPSSASPTFSTAKPAR